MKSILMILTGLLISASAGAQYYQPPPPPQYQTQPPREMPGYHWHEAMAPQYAPRQITTIEAWAAARNGYPPPPQPMVQTHPGMGWWSKNPPAPPTVVIIPGLGNRK